MSRHFMYVYERVLKEENAMKRQFQKISINGRRTSATDIKRIRNIISNSTYQIAQECQVIVSYPRMHIAGKEVDLGKATIMLPDCRLISLEELRKIELGGEIVCKEFQVRRVTNPKEGPADGVECTTKAVRTLFHKGILGKQMQQSETQVNIKASCSLGVVSISDQESGHMITVSITEMAAILNTALKAAE